MRIAFWNTGNKINNKYIKALILDNSIDTIGLAEYSDNLDELRQSLAQRGNLFDKVQSPGCEDIILFTRRGDLYMGFQDEYCSFQITSSGIILCCLHLRSDLYDGEGMRRYQIENLIKEINSLKDNSGFSKVVIFGDFNQNPYHDYCMEAELLHAISDKRYVVKGSRKVCGSNYDMYYNPMWNLFGDYTFPPGTYFHNSTKTCEPFWHMLDQVIVSSSLVDCFIDEELKIVTDTSAGSLLNKNNHPDKRISDHLPIIFEINE